jgi:hypothetical protein
MYSSVGRAFLSKLATMPKGRCGYELENFNKALELLSGLLDDGLIKARPLFPNQGFQLTDKGREFLGGAA